MYPATVVGEEDSAKPIPVILNTSPGNSLENSATIVVVATNGTASNADYDSTAFPKSVLFPANSGDGATQTVSFVPASDWSVEDDETLSLSIQPGLLLTSGGQPTHLVTIQDNTIVTDEDTPVGITITSLNAAAGAPYKIVDGPQHGSISGLLPTLLYTPASNYNGNDRFILQVDDGSDSSVEANISLVVTAVNDSPSFEMPSSLGATDESQTVVIANWASKIADGPANASDEDDQKVSFAVTTDNKGLFAILPTIDDTGKLTFAPLPNAHGTAHVSVELQDNGGTAAGGTNTSDPQSFVLTVTKPYPFHNEAPGFAMDVTDGTGNGAPDGDVAAIDVLAIINYINSHGSGPLPTEQCEDFGPPYLDVVADNRVAPNDVIAVINHINARLNWANSSGEATDESAATTINVLQAGSAAAQPETSDLISLLALDITNETANPLQV